MRTRRRVLVKLLTAASVVMLYVAALLLAAWPIVQRFIPAVDPIQLFGLAVALLATLVLDLTKRVSSQDPQEVIRVQRLSIANAFRACKEHRGDEARVLRVLASTTETILPTLRDSSIRVRSCRVMVRDFSKIDPVQADQLAKSDGLIKTWLSLPGRGVSSDVTIKRVDFWPSFFVVIFDDRALVHGLYVPGYRNKTAIHYLEPMLILNDTEASQREIDTYIRQFDEIYREYPVYAESSRKSRR